MIVWLFRFNKYRKGRAPRAPTILRHKASQINLDVLVVWLQFFLHRLIPNRALHTGHEHSPGDDRSVRCLVMSRVGRC